MIPIIWALRFQVKRTPNACKLLFLHQDYNYSVKHGKAKNALFLGVACVLGAGSVKNR